MTPKELLAKYPLVSNQVNKAQIQTILEKLLQVLRTEVPGDIVELGCYVGTTSLFLQRLLTAHAANREFHVYDSFAGLPEKSREDESRAGEQFQAGELAVGKKQFIREFQKAKVPIPIIHKAWFHDLADTDMPEQIAFAFLDGDFYESVRDSLRLVVPRMQPGGAIVVDDYAREALPGAARAVHEYFQPEQVQTAHNLGIIRL